MEFTLEELLPLLQKRVRKYTGNDSTSVPYETAREILSSILYCIAEYSRHLQSTGHALSAMDVPAPELCFQQGLALEKEKLKSAKILLARLQKHRLPIPLAAYQDTLMKGIPEFFPFYDVDYKASLDGGTIDYPLLVPQAPDLSGIDLIYDYLRHLQAEDTFLGCFPLRAVRTLLRNYAADYQQLLLNICSLVFPVSLACVLLNLPVRNLALTQEDVNHLQSRMNSVDPKDMNLQLQDSLQALFRALNLSDPSAQSYLSEALPSLSRDMQCYARENRLRTLLPTTGTYAPAVSSDHFKDGRKMDDRKLRALIEEMQTCRYLEDKLQIVKTQVGSLSDLKELLKECFWEDEYSSVFALLSDAEKEYLRQDILHRQADHASLDFWEQAYLKTDSSGSALTNESSEGVSSLS